TTERTRLKMPHSVVRRCVYGDS
ncbi:hypothetical protein VCHENC02_1829B, partial [Vibrio harveyi]